MSTRTHALTQTLTDVNINKYIYICIVQLSQTVMHQAVLGEHLG